MESDVRVLAIVINYKTPVLVIQAVESLLNDLSKEKDRITIIDNNSSDGSVEILQQAIIEKNWVGVVNLVCSKKNGGFSYGCNLGFKSYKAQFYLLLNSDAYIRENAVSELLKCSFLHSNAGIIGSRLEYDDGVAQDSCFFDLTPWHELIKTSGTRYINWFLKKTFDIEEIGISSKNCIFSPDWVSFACVLIRSEVIKSIGLMDEGFFMYREDNDYCKRARLKGWDVLYCPSSKVVHLNLGFSKNSKLRRLPKYYYYSRSRYYVKYYGRFGLWCANFLWTLGRIIHLLRERLGNKAMNVHDLAWRDIWTGCLTTFDIK